MKSIPFFDQHYPVKTIYTDLKDYQNCSMEYAGSYEDYLKMGKNIYFKSLHIARETHSGSILVMDEKDPDGRLEYVDETYTLKGSGGYDSIITSLPDLMIAIRTADCTPVFLYDTKRQVIAIAHSGWRGAASGLAVNTVRVMEKCFQSRRKDVIAAFGPCICGPCYEVGKELREIFAARFSEGEMAHFFQYGKGDKDYLDVREAVRTDLVRFGISPEHLYDTGICSYEDLSYASYRRDGKMPIVRQTLSGILLQNGRM